ncbi:hypothetical protein HYH03_016882 [Edaphochlamys debaryana]|uniref:Uncharacterized protein n=1 Tax=Edaphochlamys debaryana TaxID=47281 RepID=A0A835XNU9_9CHLO|nr:hypothetical protein HYH03_016882 [Edaphochlamys debaryana]|eukprot:KAG2484340.1 hypothetical protein HYH03_016882 [Edaphochlamys debaryana]
MGDDLAMLDQGIFECEVLLSDDQDICQGPASCGSPVLGTALHRLETMSRPACPFARTLLQRVQESVANNEGLAADVHGLGRDLAGMGYLVSVRSATGSGGSGADCFRSLRHEFLVVLGSGDYCGMEFIVEPALRQHFAIPHPSPEYALVLSHLPEVFVGGSCRLAPIVQLMCALMADSFARQGLALPPWRKEQAMLSKWMPQPHRLRDTPVLPPPAPGLPDPASPWLLDLPEATAALFARDSSVSDANSSRCCSGEFVVSRADSGSNASIMTTAPSSGVLSGGCSPVSVLPLSQAGLPQRLARLEPHCSVMGFEPQPASIARSAAAQPQTGAAGGGAAKPSATASGGPAGLLWQLRTAAEGLRRGAGSAGAGGGVIETRPPLVTGEMCIRVVRLGSPVQAPQAPSTAAGLR